MMSDPNSENHVGYSTAAPLYRDAGWLGVLPLVAGTKWPPPSIKCAEHRQPGHRISKCDTCISYTGYDGIDPSYPDILTWSDSDKYRDGNLGLRLPDGIIGIDVDHYGAKNGAATLQEATRRWGDLPPAPRSTSREDDPWSGIRLYTVPPGTVLESLITFPDLGYGDVEVIQRHHRYVAAWPSRHPEGRTYWWRNEALEVIAIPRPSELNPLPQAWLNGLKVTPRAASIDGADYRVELAMTPGDPSPPVRGRLNQAIRELNQRGVSRHDTTMRHVLALLRYGKNGLPGVDHALRLLCDVYVAAVVDRSSAVEARAEFDRMITNDGAAVLLSQGGFLNRPRGWTEELMSDPKEEGPPARQRINAERVASEPAQPGGAIFKDTSGAAARYTSDSTEHLEEIERGFWESRDSLRDIFQTSMAALGSPWAVLGICAARALYQVRPHVVLPPVIGAGPGSLNWFGAIVAAAAGGKTTAMSIAEYLVPGHMLTCQQGTGEGILKMYGKAADPSDPDALPEFEAVMLDVDEIDSLGAVSSRTGSTTMPLLRSAFSGATLGFSYSAADKRRYIRKHTYRMTGIVGMQPKRAGWILADADGGTPQRFMWFPASDGRVRRERPHKSNPLELPKFTEWLYPREIIIPKVAEDLIIDEHVKRMQGGHDALDGHALFCREKFAYALAVLDGRVVMNEQDWELSGIAADVSLYTREMVVDELKKAAHIEAVDRGEARGVENAAARASQELEEADRLRAALRWVLDKVREAAEDGVSQRDLSRASSKHTRRLLPTALMVGQQDGLVRLTEGTKKWVLV